MARKPRLDLPGYAQHIIQRGNNRQVCFVSEEDFSMYAHHLHRASQKYSVDIHAWVFMTNHVHLLVTPKTAGAVSKMMQSVGRSYVRYFNYVYQRTGTLWEGRFKSCLLDTERYLLECYRYIELNPVRAGMVTEPSQYKWSSYCVNGLGKESKLASPHGLYLKLGENSKERRQAYRELFRYQLDDAMVEDIRAVTQKGLVLGRDDFVDQVEKLTARSLVVRDAGRPKKNKNVLCPH